MGFPCTEGGYCPYASPAPGCQDRTTIGSLTRQEALTGVATMTLRLHDRDLWKLPHPVRVDATFARPTKQFMLVSSGLLEELRPYLTNETATTDSLPRIWRPSCRAASSAAPILRSTFRQSIRFIRRPDHAGNLRCGGIKM